MDNKIRIANCRGKQPVITDIKKVLNILAGVEFEMNYCELRTIISNFRDKMATILIEDNPKIKIYK
ncbi:MAG: hypothetical protein ACFE95_09735 [Candidatus Hodarchaeota archaeon]